ncbi:MAG: S-layer homology domain-containing protein [Clostridia bacterium]
MKKIISVLLALTMLTSVVALPAIAVDAAPGPVVVDAMTPAELISNFDALEDYFSAQTGSELGYATKTNSADLAWTESYAMEGYYNMYRATGELRYLTSIAAHFNEILTHMNDNGGVDPIGWDTTKYSLKKIDDPGFDKALDVAKVWKTDAGTAKIVEDGEYGKRLELAPKTTISTTIDTYALGHTYEFKLDVKTAESVKITIKNKTTGEAIAPIAPAYTPIFGSAPDGNSLKTIGMRYNLPKAAAPIVITIENMTDAATNIDNPQLWQAAQFLAHDMLICAPAAKFAEIVKGNAELAALKYDDQTTYGELADKFIKVIEPIVAKWDKDWKEFGDKGAYYWPDDESGENGFILPHNQYILMAQVMMPLYSITKNSKYLDRSTKMLTFLKSNIRTMNKDGKSFYHWNYMDKIDPKATDKHDYTEDISHGALDVAAMMMGFERGIVFDQKDMDMLVATFRATLWNGSVEAPEFYSAIESDGGPGDHVVLKAETSIRDWSYLGKWDKDIATASSVYFNKVSDPREGHPSKMLSYAVIYRAMMGDTDLIIPAQFTDIAGYEWAKNAISHLSGLKVIGGTGGGKFSPAANITRADFVVMLSRAFELKSDKTVTFSDVPAGAYYANAVNTAAALGLVGGTGGKFMPSDKITREQIVAILYRYAKSAGVDVSIGEDTNILSYDDVDSLSTYAIPAMQWACGSGIINGSGEALTPLANASRAECAVIFERAMGICAK